VHVLLHSVLYKLCHFVIDLCSPILTTFSPLQSELISAHIWDKIYHLTLIALLHYRVKYEQVQFCKNWYCFNYFLVIRKMSLWYTDWFLLTLILIHSLFASRYQIYVI